MSLYQSESVSLITLPRVLAGAAAALAVFDSVEQRPGSFLTQSMTGGLVHACMASFGINREKLVHPPHQLPGEEASPD